MCLVSLAFVAPRTPAFMASLRRLDRRDLLSLHAYLSHPWIHECSSLYLGCRTRFTTSLQFTLNQLATYSAHIRHVPVKGAINCQTNVRVHTNFWAFSTPTRFPEARMVILTHHHANNTQRQVPCHHSTFMELARETESMKHDSTLSCDMMYNITSL